MKTKDFSDYSDEKLIEMLRDGLEGIDDIILERYKIPVRRLGKGLRLMGGSEEDLMQEGMIGLFKAIRDYKPDKNCSFYTFASKCIKASMINAVIHAQSKKFTPLNTSYSLNEIVNKDEMLEFSTMLSDIPENEPENIAIDDERIKELLVSIKRVLSKREYEIFGCSMSGMTTEEISDKLGYQTKSIYNSQNRIKKKINILLGQN